MCGGAETGDWEYALELEHSMRKLAMPVGNDTSIACLRACEGASQWGEIIEIFGRMQRKVRPPEEAYTIVRNACIQGEFKTQAKIWGLFERHR